MPVREFNFSYTDTTKVKISATDKVGKEKLVYKEKNMKSELYINKAIMQLKKGDIEGAVCSMKKVIEMNDEIINTNVLADLIDKYLLT